MVHPAELCRRSPRFGHLIQLYVDNCVCENQRLRFLVKENKLFEVPTRKKRLVEVLPPFFWRIEVEVSRKLDIDVPSARSLACTRRSPWDRIGKGFRPLPDMSVVKLVG